MRRCHLPRPGAGAARTGRFPPSLEGFAAGARHCLHLLTGHVLTGQGRAEAYHGGRWPAMGRVTAAVCRCGPQAWPVPVTSVPVPARQAASTAPPAGAGCSAICTTPPLFSRRTWPCRRGAARPCTGSRRIVWGYPAAHRLTSNRFPSRAGCRQTIGAAQITIQTWHRQAGQGGSAATFAFSAAMLSAVHPGASVSDAQESA